jgi:predicted RNA-binding Zn-ribbon protein involved in translation (DUF1610 family)
MNFITIQESHYASDLYVLKSKLESEGIACRIKDEISAQVMNHLPAITAQLQVVEKDIIKTANLLNQWGITKDDSDTIFCPKCGSLEYKTKTSRISILKAFYQILKAAFLLKPIGNLFQKTTYICDICGKEFEIKA